VTAFTLDADMKPVNPLFNLVISIGLWPCLAVMITSVEADRPRALRASSICPMEASVWSRASASSGLGTGVPV